MGNVTKIFYSHPSQKEPLLCSGLFGVSPDRVRQRSRLHHCRGRFSSSSRNNLSTFCDKIIAFFAQSVKISCYRRLRHEIEIYILKFGEYLETFNSAHTRIRAHRRFPALMSGMPLRRANFDGVLMCIFREFFKRI